MVSHHLYALHYSEPIFLYSDSSTAAQSPYVIAITRSGIRVLPHIINAAILTSAFSAGNSCLFSASRILYGLALRGQAPKFFVHCTRKGLPIVAVMFSVRQFDSIQYMYLVSIQKLSYIIWIMILYWPIEGKAFLWGLPNLLLSMALPSYIECDFVAPSPTQVSQKMHNLLVVLQPNWKIR